MRIVPLDVAFSRLGAAPERRVRPLSARAQDGSLILVCRSAGFSRPAAGILRYSGQLSSMRGAQPQVSALRQELQAASTEGTPVRLIIQTPGAGGGSAQAHAREDLVGSVTAFDGDVYVVDFARSPTTSPPPVRRVRRKR